MTTLDPTLSVDGLTGSLSLSEAIDIAEIECERPHVM